MQIFYKNLTGKTIQLQVGDLIEVGPRKADGTFSIRTQYDEADDVSSAQLMYAPQQFISVHPKE